MSQENEIEAENRKPTTDFLPSDGASCSHSSGRRDRNLLVVLDEILEIIPLHELEIRRSLDLCYSASLYRAPEMQDWHSVAATLQLHCEGRTEPWIEESLAVWRDDANDQGDGRREKTPPRQ